MAPANTMSKGMVLAVCGIIVLAGGFTLTVPFTDWGAKARAEAAGTRLSADEIRRRGGGSRGSVWSNIEDAKKRQRVAATPAKQDEMDRA